jgi:hypothetical protein
MPENIPEFTNCAAPGTAHPFDFSEQAILITLGVLGVAGFLVLLFLRAFTSFTCGLEAIVLAISLIAALARLRTWYYEERLMCIREEHENQCAVGTLIGVPCLSCDGDRKLDLLIAPFGYREVDGSLLAEAIENVAASDASLPAPPADLASNRSARLAYMQGVANDPALGVEKLEKIYLELVHNILFNAGRFPGRQFQSRFYRREPPPVMPQDAYDHSPPDTPDVEAPNPLFKFDKLRPGTDVYERLCRAITQFTDECEEPERLLPFLHCEIEGDRISRGIATVQAALGFFAFTWVSVCGVCLALGGGPLLCTVLGAAAGLLIALLIWLTGPWFYDQDAAEAGEVPIDIPDPTEADASTTMQDGDVVLAYGRWIKDTEHQEFFEIHPVRAWYVVCRDRSGTPTHTDDPTDFDCAFDVTQLTEAEYDHLCGLVADAEEQDLSVVLRVNTGNALALAGGLLAS